MKGILFTFLTTLIASCNTNPAAYVTEKKKDSISIDAEKSDNKYRLFRYLDSAITTNKITISKSQAARQIYEKELTNKLLPMLTKGGYYGDIPFLLAATIARGEKVYGNFIYSSNNYYAKITALINKNQVKDLEENSTYLIKFNPVESQSLLVINGATGKTELPDILVNLKEFKKY